jgi:hypothetical protein
VEVGGGGALLCFCVHWRRVLCQLKGGFCVRLVSGVTNWALKCTRNEVLPLKPCKGRAIWLILYWLCSGTESARVPDKCSQENPDKSAHYEATGEASLLSPREGNPTMSHKRSWHTIHGIKAVNVGLGISV